MVWLLLFFAGIDKNDLTLHPQISAKITNIYYTPSKPRYSMLVKFWRGGRRKSGTIRRSRWGLLSQWSPEIYIWRLGREKAKWRVKSWLAICKSEWCCCPLKQRCTLTALLIPWNSIFMMMPSYLYATRCYCRLFGSLIDFRLQQTSSQKISCS